MLAPLFVSVKLLNCFIRPPKQVLYDFLLIYLWKTLAFILKGNRGLKIIFYLKYVSPNHRRFEEL